ncbi:MAG: dienelactone hydrolase family protein [Candidatus Kariarchaeaceae archaeon]
MSENTVYSQTLSLLPMYEVSPEGEGPFPVIIQFVHAMGIDDSAKKVCQDLAKEGYYAVAYDPYLNGKYNFQTRSDKIIFDGYDVTLNWLAANPKADMSRLGAIGFCMGGRHGYLANANYDNLKAVVSYYGFPQRGPDELSTPQNRISEFSAPNLSIFGTEDRGIPMDAVHAYKNASEAANPAHKSVIYEGAGHGFLNHNSRNHHAEASEQAWKETLDFFAQYLQ